MLTTSHSACLLPACLSIHPSVRPSVCPWQCSEMKNLIFIILENSAIQWQSRPSNFHPRGWPTTYALHFCNGNWKYFLWLPHTSDYIFALARTLAGLLLWLQLQFILSSISMGHYFDRKMNKRHSTRVCVFPSTLPHLPRLRSVHIWVLWLGSINWV